MKAASRIGLVVLAAALAGGGWYWYRAKSAQGEVRYRTAKVERGPITAVVAASGTLNAVTTLQVAAQISGQVKDIYADFKSAVKKDQIIARIDPATFELRVTQAQADLADAESALATARAERASAKQLTSAMGVVKQRQSLLRQAQADLERTVIRAPADGTVILRNVAAGQTVAAGPQAPVLFTIAQDLREMQVEAAIDAADAGRLRIGLPASLSVDALPRRSFSGEIRQIRKSSNAQNAASYTVVISAANPDLALLPGMTASVRVTADTRPSVLKVPNAALRFRPAPNAPARVWVLREGGPLPVEVRLGLTDGASTELLAGPLAEGAEVIVGESARFE